MSHGGRSSDSHPSALDGMPREGGGETSLAGSPIPRHSVERTASAETVRPADASAGAHDHPPPVPNAHSDCVVVPAATDGPRSPLVIRQPGAPSTPRHAPNVHPSQAVSSPSVLPPRPPPDPSVTAIGRSSVHGSSARPNPSLPTALQRSSPYSQGEPPHSADDESGSAEETEVEAVRTEVRETWDHGQPDNRTPTVHQPQHHSAGGSRWRDSQRGGRYDDDNDDDDDGDDDDSDVYDIHRRHHPFADKGRPRSPPNRHRYDEEDDTSSSGRTDSDASYTLKDRQDAINIIHPFGLKIWKPALYKKKRSVEQTAEREIHSRPGQWPDQKIRIGNVLWTLIFGWWMCILTLLVALMLLVPTWYSSGLPYSVVLFGLAKYLLYPFGRFVELTPDEVYAAEDEGEGHNISEYERYGAVDLERGRQLGIFFNSSMARSHGRRRGQSLGDDSEHDSLLGGDRAQAVRDGEEDSVPTKKRRYFGRGQWNVGRILFFLSFYLVIGMTYLPKYILTVAPVLLLVSGICWLTVFALPMSKVMSLLASHLRRHPLSMTFHSDLRTAASRRSGTPPAQVLVCTYRALGWEYYKYTIDGTNIFFVNLNFVVLFTIADQYLLAPLFHHKYWFVHPAFIFSLALASIIPLSYFIGMAVASISAQSSMGTGAAINAFFGSVIEVYLYSVALTQGKSRLVEGSIVGNIFAGTLLMPGTSMLFGALRHKTQHFNAKSAGVTSTMLLFSVIGAFAPTILYQIYGNVPDSKIALIVRRN